MKVTNVKLQCNNYSDAKFRQKHTRRRNNFRRARAWFSPENCGNRYRVLRKYSEASSIRRQSRDRSVDDGYSNRRLSEWVKRVYNVYAYTSHLEFSIRNISREIMKFNIFIYSYS